MSREIVDGGHHDRIIRRERHLRECLRRERDQTDAITPAHIDELFHFVLGDFDSILWLKVNR
jgi:hypothetical protein